MNVWDRLVGDPLAHFVGPFPHRPFLEVSASHGGGEVEVVATGSSAVALVVFDGTARFVGDRQVTDYHSPLGTETQQLVDQMLADLDGVSFDLDSLPLEAVGPLESAFEAAGRAVTRTADEACRVLDLDRADPGAWDSVLRSKHRHEVRRKRRRYEEAMGAPDVVTGSEHLDAFVAFHRSSRGDKGDFMTDPMKAFFAEILLRVPTARLDVMQRGGEAVAAAIGFDADDAYYLYNSAYDVGLAELSPGIVLIDHLITRTMGQGKRRFDFLKGSEAYKGRLGAEERRLFRLEVAA